MTFSPKNYNSVPQRMFALTAICAALLAFGGCGNDLSQVTGLVTLDGQPLHGGKGDTRVTVQLQPVDGVGANAVGLADEEGKYKIATGSQVGIRPGDYYVTCAVSTLKAGGPVADPKYANAKTSGLKITVHSGKNEFNIPLQSVPRKAPRTSG